MLRSRFWACALRVSESSLPSSPTCTITEFTAKPPDLLSGLTDDPSFIQGKFGARGNFELIGVQGDKLVHFFRNNDAVGNPWRKSVVLPQWIGATPFAVSMIQGNFADLGHLGNLEAVAWMSGLTTGNFLASYFRDSAFDWQGPSAIIADGQRIGAVSGDPVLIQGTFGTKGNFELLVPEGQRLVHYFRDNDAANLPWHRSVALPLLAGARPLSAAMIQSNFAEPGAPGNLEVIARAAGITTGDFLASYFRDITGTWYGPSAIVADGRPIDGVTGKPAFIQSTFGNQGNFELIVPQGSQLVHYFRDNDTVGNPWHRSVALPAVPGASPLSVTVIQSNFAEPGLPGNLEVVARMSGAFTGDFLAFYFRTADLKWHGPFNLSR